MKTMFAALLATTAAISSLASAADAASPIRNVVLVHGAFADASGWRGVYDRLIAKGYHVTMVQEPETSLGDDVAATQRILDSQDGPVVLVGHSWGGQVITVAGADPKVKALVYVSAIVPEAGESVDKVQGTMPAVNNDVKKTADGLYFYLEPARFHADFCADAPARLAAFMARSQVLPAVAAFAEPAKTAAWQTKPGWGIVSGADKTINPDLERWMYKRAHLSVTEIAGASHASFLAHPEIVASVIEQAAGAK